MTIKQTIKDFDQSISFLQKIRNNIDDVYVEIISTILIRKLKELREIFIDAVTYNEVN